MKSNDLYFKQMYAWLDRELREELYKAFGNQLTDSDKLKEQMPIKKPLALTGGQIEQLQEMCVTMKPTNTMVLLEPPFIDKPKTELEIIIQEAMNDWDEEFKQWKDENENRN